jgi:hypothetical protein
VLTHHPEMTVILNAIVSLPGPVFRRNVRLKCLRRNPVRAHCTAKSPFPGDKLT